MKTILFCGGGSAGHVIPNIALIDDLKGSFNCVYVGTDGIEKSICARHGVVFYEYSAPKLVRGKILCNLAVPFRLIKSVNSAKKLIAGIKPDLIFSKGGYASLPIVLAAGKTPVITHESDLEPGLTTKLIAKRCEKVLTSFPSTARTFKNGICTGSPMRMSLFAGTRSEALKKFGLTERPTILVLGGGSGSKTINENVRKILPSLCKNFNVLHICGKGNAVNINIRGYKQIEFTDDMGAVFACADCAVSRCGSNAAFELIAMKIPTLFIPLENSASRGDQIKNAEYFSGYGLCNILHEKDLSPETLEEKIGETASDKKIEAALESYGLKCGNEKIKREVLYTIRQLS